MHFKHILVTTMPILSTVPSLTPTLFPLIHLAQHARLTRLNKGFQTIEFPKKGVGIRWRQWEKISFGFWYRRGSADTWAEVKVEREAESTTIEREVVGSGKEISD
ncbi:hypothetical protein I312_105175 [Cryptococcus bacillisporus CA1280]|uniref:uncharacterized protein n=1 Tax=Cryptococcus bacillisporus CA1280 TaxID=1296109 RepID=UPI0033682525